MYKRVSVTVLGGSQAHSATLPVYTESLAMFTILCRKNLGRRKTVKSSIVWDFLESEEKINKDGQAAVSNIYV